MVEIGAAKSEHSAEPGTKIPSLFSLHLFITLSITAFHINDAWNTNVDFSTSVWTLGNNRSLLVPSFDLGLSINKLYKDFGILIFSILNNSRKV